MGARPCVYAPSVGICPPFRIGFRSFGRYLGRPTKVGPGGEQRLADTAGAGAHGAYGLQVAGLEGAEELLLRVPDTWPLLTVRWIEEGSAPTDDEGPPDESTVTFADGRAVVDHGRAGTIEIEREPAVATFRISKVRDPRALVHPYLGGAASIVGRWLGRETFHAGAFVCGSEAWAVLGARTAGKSSFLGWLHARGMPILADDIVVVAGGRAFAAPRSLDLREESAQRLALGEALGRVGARDRWRVTLEPVPLEVPLAGFVFLAWGEEVDVVPLEGHARLTRLAAELTIPDRPADPSALLELAALPALELRRPRDWDAFDAAGEALLAALGC